MISAGTDVAVFALLSGAVAVGVYLNHTALGKHFGVLTMILAPALLGALGVLPRDSRVYGFVTTDLLALAIPLILFDANLRVIWRTTGRLLAAFCLSATGVILGALAASRLVDLGADESSWVAIIASGFVGGAVNVATVASSLNVLEHPFLGVIIASVYVVAIPYFLLLIALPKLGPLWRVVNGRTHEPAMSAPAIDSENERRGADLAQLTLAIFLASLAAWSGAWVADAVAFAPAKYLTISAVAVAIATWLPRYVPASSGRRELGNLGIFLFLAVLGARIDFSGVEAEGVPVVIFTLLTLALHALVTVVLGRLLRFSGAELVVATNAAVFGPPTAAAMAEVYQWSDLVSPSVLVGVFGWAVASFLGVGLAMLL